MDFNGINCEIGKITMSIQHETQEDLIEQNDLFSQSELVGIINHEFQKDFIKKLYPNPLWTKRVYWNVIGRIQDEHDDIPLDDIIKGVDKYLNDNNMCISQRDVLKFIRDTIMRLQVDGPANISDVALSATTHGIAQDRFNEAIKHMKADGSIFETPEGYYKCV